MKAMIYKKYGQENELKLIETDSPTPKDHEVLIKVHAVSLNRVDVILLTGKPFFIRLAGCGLLKPKHSVLGADVSGVVEIVGKNVIQFKPGDEVFGDLSACGIGGLAEYVCADEKALALKPANISFEEAAAAPMAAVTALQALKRIRAIQPGEKVLINGASGGVGTFAVQIAKAFGAEVTAVCSTRNLEMVHSLGADHIIDYKKEDFTKSGQQYDLILAVNGYHPISDYLGVLKPEGTYVVAGGSMVQLFQAASRKKKNSNTGGQKIVVSSLVQSQKDLNFIKELIESGKIKPVIDGCYPLSKTPEAFRYFENEHPRGKVVITME